MKRTPLKRKTPLKAKSGIKPGGRLKAKSTTKRDPRWRSRKYLNWVKRQPCVMTGMPADDPHHLIGTGGMGGAGIKAPDWAVMPVTRGAHDQIHQAPELWSSQWEWIARTLGRAIEEGVLVVNGKALGGLDE